MSATEDRRSVGSPTAAISNAVVRIVVKYIGRGPTSVRTFIEDALILVLMHGTLTKGERSLVAAGDAASARELRQRFHKAMRDDLVAAVEALSGRAVIAFLSDNDAEADVLMQVFVLEAP